MSTGLISEMNSETIDDAICDLLREHGPDGHIDGHEEITAYVLRLLVDERSRCAAIANAHPGACQSGCDTGREIAAEIVEHS